MAGILLHCIKLWKIYIEKTEVVSFVIESDRKFTVEVIVKTLGRGCCFFNLTFFWGYINGIQLAQFGLLIDRTSTINLKLRLKAIASVFFFVSVKFLYKLRVVSIENHNF